MKLRIFTLLALFSWSILVQAEVLDFESPVTDSCGSWGLSPTGWTVLNETAAVSDADACTTINTDGAFSGSQYLLNFNSRVGTLVRDAGEFYLNGAYFHADDRAGSALLEFAGYDSSDVLLFSTSVQVGTDWQWVQFDWPGITKFTWDPVNPDVTNISVDDLTFDAAVIGEQVAVPSLTTYGLILAIIGFLLIATFRFRALSGRV